MILKLEGLKKPKGMKGLSGLGRKVKATPMPDLDSGPDRIQSLVDDELARLIDMLGGDEKLAKRIQKLKKKFYNVISGTIPELIIMDWLDRQRYRYEFQFWILGGREIRGGQVLDFVVEAGPVVIIIEMQGYFHIKGSKVSSDAAQRFALMGVRIWGRPVKIVEVWERRLLDKHLRNPALEAAMQGIELGK